MNRNRLTPHLEPTVLFVDMNSFFASCEQQENYWLRGRPIAVCVYTGRRSCVIAPSIEAKLRGVKLGLRLDEAMKICPDLVPVETHSERYRKYHREIIGVLKKFSQDVIPRSIDEAVVNLTDHRLLHKDPVDVAQRIKQAIRSEVGDWLKCSIGIAPNAFLAKLASDLKKPDGLTIISPDTIDGVLQNLKLTDLPGIAQRMANRLIDGGIRTPLDLRYASPVRVRAVCRSIVGLHWHFRLNFGEVDLNTTAYKSMSAMRSLSWEQRRDVEGLVDILRGLCVTLERRMVYQNVFCRKLWLSARHENGKGYSDELRFDVPVQDGIQLFNLLTDRMRRFESLHGSEPVLNLHLLKLAVGVHDFVPEELVQYTLFENRSRQDHLRKTMYEIKEKFGTDKLIRAVELRDEATVKDVIGFGNIKDLHDDQRVRALLDCDDLVG